MGASNIDQNIPNIGASWFLSYLELLAARALRKLVQGTSMIALPLILRDCPAVSHAFPHQNIILLRTIGYGSSSDTPCLSPGTKMFLKVSKGILNNYITNPETRSQNVVRRHFIFPFPCVHNFTFPTPSPLSYTNQKQPKKRTKEKKKCKKRSMRKDT